MPWAKHRHFPHLDRPTTTFTLPDGYRMVWEQPSEPFIAKRGYSLHFKLLTPDGAVPEDMAF